MSNNIRFPEDYNPRLAASVQAPALVASLVRQRIHHGEIWREATQKAFAALAGSDEEGFFEAIKQHLRQVVAGACMQGLWDADNEGLLQ